MVRREKISGDDFWLKVEEDMKKTQPPVKEWTYLYEVRMAEVKA